jgi:hypothetical protein
MMVETKEIRYLRLFYYFNRTIYFSAAELNTISSNKKRKISAGYKKRQERPLKTTRARKRTRTPDLTIAPKDPRSSVAFNAPPPELHTISWSLASPSTSSVAQGVQRISKPITPGSFERLNTPMVNTSGGMENNQPLIHSFALPEIHSDNAVRDNQETLSLQCGQKIDASSCDQLPKSSNFSMFDSVTSSDIRDIMTSISNFDESAFEASFATCFESNPVVPHADGLDVEHITSKS